MLSAKIWPIALTIQVGLWIDLYFKMCAMNRHFRLPFFDPDYCLKVVRWASATCLGWLLIEFVLLVFVSPKTRTCAGWTIHAGQRSEANAGLLMFIFTALPAAWICWVAFRWRRFSEKFYNSILERPELVLNHNRLWLVVCVGWTLFCSWPLWFTISNCML